MAKYSTELKMKVVKEYLETNTLYKSLLEEYKLSHHEIIKRWVDAYESQGYGGLKVKRGNTQCTLEFKLSVVNLYLTGEMSYQNLANNLEINSPSIITRWVTEYRKRGIEGLRPKKRGGPSKMAKTPRRPKDTKLGLSSKSTNEEDSSLNEAQLKEEIKKLEERNYWLQLKNDAIRKKIGLSRMTDIEVRQLLKQLRS